MNLAAIFRPEHSRKPETDSAHATGRNLDALVSWKVMNGVERRYSSNLRDTSAVYAEVLRRGYELAITEDVTVRCAVFKDSQLLFSVWSGDYQTAICQAALKILEREPT